MRRETALTYPPLPWTGCDAPSWGSTQEDRKRVEHRTIGFQKTVTEHMHKGLGVGPNKDRRLEDTVISTGFSSPRQTSALLLSSVHPGPVSAATSRIAGPARGP